MIPEAPSRGNALGDGLCKGGRSKQIGQGKLIGRDPGGHRYHGLAAWFHQTTGMASAIPAHSMARGLGQKPSPTRPRFPSLQGTLISMRPAYTDNPSSQVTSHWQRTQRILRKQDLLYFMAAPSHWWQLGCWQQATQPLRGHTSDFYQERQYFPHQGTRHLLGRCSRTDIPGEATHRGCTRH